MDIQALRRHVTAHGHDMSDPMCSYVSLGKYISLDVPNLPSAYVIRDGYAIDQDVVDIVINIAQNIMDASDECVCKGYGGYTFFARDAKLDLLSLVEGTGGA